MDGHGNFGSVDGDPPRHAPHRSGSRPSRSNALRDIEKETVAFGLNFDDSNTEPVVPPGRYPNLLVNGASGIAVGLATNIPPHNLGRP